MRARVMATVGARARRVRAVLAATANATRRSRCRRNSGVALGRADRRRYYVDHHVLYRFIGECKIWHGLAKFAEAVDQLLGYTIWRDTRIALILFIRDRVDTSAVIESAGATISSRRRRPETRHQTVAAPGRRASGELKARLAPTSYGHGGDTTLVPETSLLWRMLGDRHHHRR